MNVSAVLNLHSLFLRRNESPKLLLHVIFRNNNILPDPRFDRVILNVVTRRVGGEPHTAELPIPSLETGQTVFFAFVESIIASGPE